MSEKVFILLQCGGTLFRGYHYRSRIPALLAIFQDCINSQVEPMEDPDDVILHRIKTRLSSMTHEEKLRTITSTGVIYPNGNFAVEYGGYDIGKEYIAHPILLP